MISGQYHVTEHAVLRFIERIAPLDFERALAGIIQSIAHPDARWRPDKQGVSCVRTKAPYAMRVFVAGPTEDGKLPSVTTVLPGTKTRNSPSRARYKDRRRKRLQAGC